MKSKIQEDSGLRHDQVVDVLLPINAGDVGQLVGLIQDVIEFREDDTESGGSADRSPVTGDGWDGPQIGADAVQGTLSREELEGPDEATGVEFLQENNALGFVRINQEPEHVAMYISDDVQEVLYVARGRERVSATEAQLARTLESYVGDQAEFDQDKKVVLFEPGSLYELANPIEYESRVPYSLRYTELGRFQQAGTTDDIL